MNTAQTDIQKLVPIGNVTLKETSDGLEIFCAEDTGTALLPETFPIPARINVTAKTNSTNIRLRFGSGQVILNWECNRSELRIHDPLLGTPYGVDEKGKIPKHEYVDISWIIGLDYMALLVNGEVRLFSENEPYMQLARLGADLPSSLAGIAAAWGSTVTVKKFEVVEWKLEEHSADPLAIVTQNSKAVLKPGDSMVLESSVFPSTSVNQTIHWSTEHTDVISIHENDEGKLVITAQKDGIAAVNGVTESGGISVSYLVKCFTPNFQTNLNQLQAVNGEWTIENRGLVGVASGPTFCGNAYMLSSDEAEDFSYETEVSIRNGIAAALVFRATEQANGFYCANIDMSGIVKLWRPGKDIQIKPTPISRNAVYHLKVVVIKDHIQVYLDGKLMIDVHDDTYSSGRLGLNVFCGKGLFQNTIFERIT